MIRDMNEVNRLLIYKFCVFGVEVFVLVYNCVFVGREIIFFLFVVFLWIKGWYEM